MRVQLRKYSTKNEGKVVMIKNLNAMRNNEEGFTLVELLVVIVILGVLAAVAVFAVSGISDRGQASACATDAKTVKTAEETYFAKNSTYGNEFALKAGGFLAEYSTYDDATVGADTATATSATNTTTTSATGAAYVVKIQSASCGTVGTVV
jgi:prepilin-type N-terminal cleavage/methylation domain-containing protein